MIKTEKKDWQPVQRRIVVDEIQTLLVLHVPGQAGADKKRKAELVRKHFMASWTEIEEVMPLFDLRAGYDSLHLELEGKPSRYNTAVVSVAAPARTVKEEINDSLPDHSAATVDETDPFYIPDDLKREKPGTVKDRLLSDIPTLATANECLSWGLAMSDTFETLNKKDKELVRVALMAQQAKVMNGSGRVAS
jgi:hypothetical protein